MGSDQSVPNRQGSRDIASPTSPTSPNFDHFASLNSRENSVRKSRHNRHDSVASDLFEGSQEVPYVSYTTNRAIGAGDSPKKKKKSSGLTRTAKQLKFPVSLSSKSLRDSSHNTLVVVNSSTSIGNNTESSNSNHNNKKKEEQDAELSRLREIPSFLPIVGASLSGIGAKDPDILERLDYRGLLSLCRRYEDHLRLCAVTVSSEQSDLNRGIKEIDLQIAKVAQDLGDRQKSVARQAEKLSKVREMSKCLSRCHLLLNENIEQMEVLNNLLPTEERLEPFVWTTG